MPFQFLFTSIIMQSIHVSQHYSQGMKDITAAECYRLHVISNLAHSDYVKKCQSSPQQCYHHFWMIQLCQLTTT